MGVFVDGEYVVKDRTGVVLIGDRCVGGGSWRNEMGCNSTTSWNWKARLVSLESASKRE